MNAWQDVQTRCRSAAGISDKDIIGPSIPSSILWRVRSQTQSGSDTYRVDPRVVNGCSCFDSCMDKPCKPIIKVWRMLCPDPADHRLICYLGYNSILLKAVSTTCRQLCGRTRTVQKPDVSCGMCMVLLFSQSALYALPQCHASTPTPLTQIKPLKQLTIQALAQRSSQHPSPAPQGGASRSRCQTCHFGASPAAPDTQGPVNVIALHLVDCSCTPTPPLCNPGNPVPPSDGNPEFDEEHKRFRNGSPISWTREHWRMAQHSTSS